MATLRVDLTSKEASKIAKANRLIDRIKLASGVTLGIFVLVVGGVFGYFFFLSTRAVRIDARVQTVINEIQTKSESEVLYRRLADIVQESKSLIEMRQDYAGVLLEIYGILPSQAIIEGVRFEDRSVIVDVRTVGVQEMSTTLNVIKEINSDRFSGVTLDSVRKTDNGNYFIRIKLGLRTV